MEHRLPVHRVALGDLPERRLGLRQGALLLVRRPQEEAHLRVPRVGREDEGELVDRVVEPVAIEVKKPQLRADVGVGGGELLQLLVLVHRLVDLLLPDQQAAEPVPEERVVRGGVERVPVPLLRLRVPAEDLENRAGLEERGVEARGDREGLVVVGQGLLELLLGREDRGPGNSTPGGNRGPGRSARRGPPPPWRTPPAPRGGWRCGGTRHRSPGPPSGRARIRPGPFRVRPTRRGSPPEDTATACAPRPPPGPFPAPPGPRGAAPSSRGRWRSRRGCRARSRRTSAPSCTIRGRRRGSPPGSRDIRRGSGRRRGHRAGRRIGAATPLDAPAGARKRRRARPPVATKFRIRSSGKI